MATYAKNSVEPASLLVKAKAFPIKGQTEGLEPEVLDFRYAPPIRQEVCIGLPDDLHKSMVDQDGGLCYDYLMGRGYDTRILAGLNGSSDTKGKTQRRWLSGFLGDAEATDTTQRLWDARTPIVFTEKKYGEVTLRQAAWADIPEGNTLEERIANRVDYLLVKAENGAAKSKKARITVQINSKHKLKLNQEKTALVEVDDPDRVYCAFSPACEDAEFNYESGIIPRSDHGISRDWAAPEIECNDAFKHILLGGYKSLEFYYSAKKKNESFKVAFGLIEGYHSSTNQRIQEIYIEGEKVKTVDMTGEYGKNMPAVFIFDAKDLNGDGEIDFAVKVAANSPDKNTVLSGLWLFEPGKCPSEQEIVSGNVGEGLVSVVNLFEGINHSVRLSFGDKKLAANRKNEVLLALYQGADAKGMPKLETAQSEMDEAVAFWRDVDLPYDRLLVSDDAVQDLLDSSIRNIYQAREIRAGLPAFLVGPTCYRNTWAADGPFLMEAITYLGRPEEGRGGLEQQVDMDEGPGGIEFSKKTGLRLWMIWRHAQLTGDWEWLEESWPRVEREVANIKRYREISKEDPEQMNYGLMPIGIGDGGLAGPYREYTNVYWTLAGMRAAIEMANKLGKTGQLYDWQAENEEYWSYFNKARERDKLVDHAGNTYVPVTMTGEEEHLPQRGAWAFMHSVFPGRIYADDDALMLGNMAALDSAQSEGLIFATGWLKEGLWSYAGSFYAHAHLWLGHGKKASSTLYAFANHASPLLCWREEHMPQGVAHDDIGDMPHNWASAEFIRLIRHLLILERGEELHLFEGMPASWVQAGKSIKALEIPTSFGDMTLEVDFSADGKSATVRCDPPVREQPDSIVVHLEHFGAIKGLELDGQPMATEQLFIPSDRPFNLVLKFADTNES